MITYRWRGTDRRGNARSGRAEFERPSALAAMTAMRWRAGWKDLLVVQGDGPVPPSRDEEPVARIDRTLDKGKRVWWAESEET